MGKTDGVGNAMVKIMTYILVALLILGVAGGAASRKRGFSGREKCGNVKKLRPVLLFRLFSDLPSKFATEYQTKRIRP